MFDSLSYYGSIALAVYKALALVVITASIIGIAYIAKKSAGFRSHGKKDKFVLPRAPQEFSATRRTHQRAATVSMLREQTIARWKDIVDRLEKQDIKDYKFAIIEADALTDAALRSENFPGENMSDRMRSIPSGRLSCMEEFWQAHKVRNDIAHDPYYVVSPRAGHDTMKIYKYVLEELGVL